MAQAWPTGGGSLEQEHLPAWTLNARQEGDQLEFSLGDGRRLSWRSRRPAELALHAASQPSAEQLLGPELAARLASSPPRSLHIQYESALDALPWEALDLGDCTLAMRFALGRQLLSRRETPPPPQPVLSDELDVLVLQGSQAALAGLPNPVPLAELSQAWARQQLARAQVLVLDGLSLAELLTQVRLDNTPRLLLAACPQATGSLEAALDTGAGVLCLSPGGAFSPDGVNQLLAHLRAGDTCGQAVRSLHQRAAPQPYQARLYGDPDIRFVHPAAPVLRRQVTSLSFDLVGSTSLLQQLGDEAYAERLALLHRRCQALIRQHGGQANDPQGSDGVMCYFGHPKALENAALRAVEAGLALTRAVADMGASVRVGIATGPVAVMARQPVGLSIHLAARLQQAAEPGTVLMSEATSKLVGQQIELQALAHRPVLKGIDSAEDYYLARGLRQDSAPPLSTPDTPTAPLFGRDTELQRLHTAWQQASNQACQVMGVQGDAGMGKSRLIQEFRRQLVANGVRVLECRCRPDASASPYLTLAEAIRRWLDIRPQDNPRTSLLKLAAALPMSARQTEPLTLLAQLLGIATPPPASPQAAAPTGGPRRRLLDLLLGWFGNFAGDQPCCVMVEDWHWVDPSLREFVEHLAQRQTGPALLIVITSRTEISLGGRPLAATQHLTLHGLGPDAAMALVHHVFQAASLPPAQLRQLAERGDGVPLFLEQAARLALELGVKGFQASQGGLQAVPASLHDLLMARLDSLGRARPVAQVAAVLGREFQLDMLSALLDVSGTVQDSQTLQNRVDELLRSQLVRRESSGAYSFKHALIRDVAYGSLWVRDRLALHARVVELLEGRWAELGEQRPELLALHQTEAGLHAQALVQWQRAAGKAAARSAEVEAISHLRQALAVLPHLPPGPERDRKALKLQLLLASRLIATEGYGAESVLKAYTDAKRLCEQVGDDTDRFKVEMGLEAYRFMRADFEPALEHGRRAADIAAATGDIKQRLHAHWGLACTLFHQGRLRATMREMDAALALYTPAMHPQFGIQDPGVMCMAYSSWGLWELGQPDAALARINRAVDIASESEHKFNQAVAMSYAVSIELLRGDTEAALARVAQCIQLCEENVFPVWLAIARCMRGHLLCRQDQFETGIAETQAGYALWLSTGAKVSQPLCLALQAEGCMRAGRLDAAQASVTEGLAIVERFGERQMQAELLRLQGELVLLRGPREDAEQWFKRSYALATRQHRLGFALRSATSLARLWADDGRREQARRLLAPLASRWTEGLATHDVRAARLLCSALA